MKAIHVPRIDARYWAGITMASVFGTNTGDWFAFRSGLGILGGLPYLAAIIAVVWFLERRDNTKHEAWYWLAIILIRTGATNIADFACGRRFLGIDLDFGKRLGLSPDWTQRVIKQVGNYGELFDRHLGAKSPLKLERRLNNLATNGGLHYAPSFR